MHYLVAVHRQIDLGRCSGLDNAHRSATPTLGGSSCKGIFQQRVGFCRTRQK